MTARFWLRRRSSGREIECAVFGNGTEPVIASGVGEILAAADFYDFDAKYYNAESRTVVNPELPGDATERVRQAARRIFKAVDGLWPVACRFLCDEGRRGYLQ